MNASFCTKVLFRDRIGRIRGGKLANTHCYLGTREVGERVEPSSENGSLGMAETICCQNANLAVGIIVVVVGEAIYTGYCREEKLVTAGNTRGKGGRRGKF